MKKLFYILIAFFLCLLSSMFIIKKIYVNDYNDDISIEVHSNNEILKKTINIDAQYCTILFKLNCTTINNIEIEENINYDILGEYNIKINIKHNGKDKVLEKKVNVIDTTPPVITLNETPLLCPNQFIEPGYEVKDNYDNNLNEKVIVNKVNNIVYYEITDSSGNKSKAERNLTYGDTTAPKIILNGNETEYVLINNNFKDPGYTVSDNCDNDLKNKVAIQSNVDTSKVGTYTIKYSITDSSGNKTSQTRYVKIFKKSENITIIPSNKVVYLTFDDGPGGYTEELLNILKKYNVKATFFVTNQFPRYKNVIKRIYNEGHAIGLHTYSHQYETIYSSIDAYFKDIDKIDKIVYNLTGTNSKLLRFAGGSSNTISNFNKGIMTILSKETEIRGYKYFDWNVDSGDINTSNSTKIANNVINGMKSHNYSVVLQHDTKKASVNAVESIIKYGLANGYTFLPLDMTSPTAHHGINN